MKQTDLELEMVELGKSRYWAGVNKARDLEIESTTGPGQRLLSEAVKLMGEGLTRWLKEAKDKPGSLHRAYKYLTQLPPKVIAAITARCILDCISQQRKITATAINVARLLEDEVKFLYLQENEPALWRHIHRQVDRHKSYETKAKFIKNTAKYNEIILEGWPKKEAVAVGLVCIELLRQSTGIIEISTRRDTRGRSATIIRATEDILDWIKKSHGKSEILKPMLMPMVEKPRDWGPNDREGGYLNTSFSNRGLVKTTDHNYSSQLTNLDMPKVYTAINGLQNTGFIVDNRMADIMRYLWEKGYAVGGLPSMVDEPVPSKPIDIETNKDSRRAWRKAAARVHFENERQQSRRLQAAKVLYLADRFKDEEIFYPHQLDFRSRGYPLPPFLQPQGVSYARASLRFSRKVPITDDNGVSWLATHVANTWGMDKLSYDERVAWVEENERLIRGVASDPYRNMEWADADAPWHFLQAATEWNEFLNHGMGYPSNLPVSQDATTQGLQIYAKLLLDPVAGLATNVLPRDRPGDVYGDVADLVIEKLKISSDPYAPLWLAFGIGRTTTKRQTMTLTYGSVFYSCREYTTEWFYDRLAEGMVNPFGDETYKPCHFLAKIIWESISEVVQSARIGMDWLREVATICMDNDVNIQWVTPNGFLVKMDYPKMGKYEVKTTIGPVVRQHRIRVPLAERNRRKNINAVAANWVHSLDGLGGLLGSTLDMLMDHGVKDFLSVHDSLSVHAQHAGALSGCVRASALEMFTPDLLMDFHDQVSYLLPSMVSLPDPPQRGTMDLTKVLDSPYYWN